MNKKISEKQIIAILDNKLISFVNEETAIKVFNYAFGEDFMKIETKDKEVDYIIGNMRKR
tara:strand:- start:518 stop:697 length:180 start_codon:yes stop_codon:yes gene_type:complete